MCPACFATLSMMVAGAISTGGATALAARMFRRRKGLKDEAAKDSRAGDAGFRNSGTKEK
jgi:hypothetical protein